MYTFSFNHLPPWQPEVQSPHQNFPKSKIITRKNKKTLSALQLVELNIWLFHLLMRLNKGPCVMSSGTTKTLWGEEKKKSVALLTFSCTVSIVSLRGNRYAGKNCLSFRLNDPNMRWCHSGKEGGKFGLSAKLNNFNSCVFPQGSTCIFPSPHWSVTSLGHCAAAFARSAEAERRQTNPVLFVRRWHVVVPDSWAAGPLKRNACVIPGERWTKTPSQFTYLLFIL